MRRATLGYMLLSPTTRARLAPLHLRPPPPRLVGARGTLECVPAHDFEGARAAIASNAFVADETVLTCVRGVFHDGFFLRQTKLVDDEMGKLSLPCK
eukprot:5353580-Pleurochrysis_carterae.AAC.2